MKRVVRKIGAACLSFAMLFNANMPTVLIAEDVPQESTPEPIEEEKEEPPVETEEPGGFSDGEPVVTVDEEPAQEAVPTENTPEPADQPAAEPAAEQPVSETPAAEDVQPTEQPEEKTEPEETEEPGVSYQIIGVFQGDDGQSVESELNPGEDPVSVSELAQPLEGYTWTGSAVITRPDETVDTVTAISDSAYVVKNDADGDYTVSFDDAFGAENTTVYVVFAYTKDIVVEEPESEPEPVYEQHFEFENHRVHVTADAHEGAEIPEGSELHADYLVPGSSAYRTAVAAILAGTDADPDKTEFELYDIYFTHEGNRIEPNDNVDVTLSFKRTVAPKKDNGEIANAEVVHVDNDNNGEVVSQQNVVTSESGIEEISFTNDSFSPYGVKYTVDYTYSGYTWSMEGGTEIYLSDLFGMLGIPEDAANVTGIEFTNYDLISVEQTEGNWILKSLKPFDTSEVLTVTMANGDKYIIDVTDEGEQSNLPDIANIGVTIVDQKDTYDRDESIQFELDFSLKSQWQENEGTTWIYDLSSLIGEDNVLLGLATGSGALDQSGGNEKGTYEITEDKIILHLKESWISGNPDKVKGFVKFTAQLNSSQNQKKDSDDITFPGEAKVHIDYTQRSLTTTKTVGASQNSQSATTDSSNVQMTKNADGTYTLYYTITAQPNTDLDTLSVSDTLSGGQKLNAGSVAIKINGEDKTSAATLSTSDSGFSVTAFPAIKANDNVSITYTTIVTQEQLNNVQSNDSAWTWDGNTKRDNTKVTPVYEQKLNSNKYVGASVNDYKDYEDGQDMTFTINPDGSYTVYYKLEVKPNTPIETLTVTDTLGQYQTGGDKFKITINVPTPQTYNVNESVNAVYGTSYDLGSYIKTITKTDYIPAGTYSIEYSATVSAEDAAAHPEALLTNSANWNWNLGTVTDNTSVKTKQPEHNVTKTQVVSGGDHQNVQPGDTITYTIQFGTDSQGRPVNMAGQTITDTIEKVFDLDGTISVSPALPDGSTSISSDYAITDNFTKDQYATLFEYTFPSDEGPYNGPYTITYTVKVPETSDPRAASLKDNFWAKNSFNDGTKGVETTSQLKFGEQGGGIKKEIQFDPENNQILWTITVNINEGSDPQNIAVTEEETKYGPGEWETNSDLPIDWEHVEVECEDGTAYDGEWRIGELNGKKAIYFDGIQKSVVINLVSKSPVPLNFLDIYWAKNGAKLYRWNTNYYQEIKYVEAKDKYSDLTVGVDKNGTIDSDSGIATWTVVINSKKRTYNPNKTPYFTDVIPEGMTYVNDSMSITYDYQGNTLTCKPADPVNITGNTISSLDISHVKDAYNTWYGPGLSGAKYTVTYQTRIDPAVLEQLKNRTIGSTSYTNSVSVTDSSSGGNTLGTASTTVDYTYENLVDKSLKEFRLGEYIDYTIIANPDAQTLNDGQTIELEDRIDTNVELVTDSYSITDGNGNAIAGAVFSYSDATRLMEVYIPDSTKAVITYTVRARENGMQTFTNSVKLVAKFKGEDSESDNFQIVKSSGGIEGALDTVSIKKIDKFSPKTTLGGAEFKLYQHDYDPVTGMMSEGDGVLLATETTAGDGKAAFEGKVEPYTLYYWIESKAPVGYAPTSTERHYFVTYARGKSDDETHANRDRAWAIDDLVSNANNIIVASVADGYEWTVDNTPKTGLTITKTWNVNEGELTDLEKEALEITITGRNIGGEGINTLTIHYSDFTEGSYTVEDLPLGESYTVTEANAEDISQNYVLVTGESTTSATAVISNVTGKGNAELVNTYQKKSGSLKVEKSFSDNVLPENLKNLVTFEVTGPNNYRQTFTYAQMTNGEKQFDNLPLGNYTVKESATFDGYTWTKSVTVNSGNPEESNEATATVTNGETATVAFTNSYTKKTGKATIQATKSITNGTLTGNDFEFQLVETDKNGTPLTGKDPIKAKNNAEGEVTFPEITYDATGEYYYKVTEVGRGTTQNGVKYSNAEYLVKVTVTEDKNKPDLETSVDKEAAELTFVNEYTSSGSVSIPVKKALEGRTLQAEEFEFYLERKNEGGTWTRLQVRKNKADGTVAFDDLAYTQNDVGKDQSKPVTYRIVEKKGTNSAITYAEHVEFTVTITDNGQGTINAVLSDPYSASNPITLNNTYTSSGSVELHAHKTLTGRTLTENEFEFILSDSTGEIKRAKNAANGTVTFDAIEYTQADLEKSPLTYTITELPGTEAGVTYDTHTETVTVTLTDDGKGHITATPQYASGDDAYFVNQYHASGAFSISARKELTGRTLQNGEFTFELYEGESASGTPIRTTTNSGQNVTFDAISLTERDFADATEITKTYTIKEVSGSVSGITYDEHLETVTVKAKLVGSTITTSVTYDEDGAVFTNAYTSEGSVSLNAKKELEGKELTTGAFTFILKRQDGNNITYKLLIKTAPKTKQKPKSPRQMMLTVTLHSLKLYIHRKMWRPARSSMKYPKTQKTRAALPMTRIRKS